jgi:hypothetical protein
MTTRNNAGDEGSDWHKSSFSMSGDCVEIRRDSDGTMQVRDSKDPDGPVLSFTRSEWRAFLLGVKAHEFGDPDFL